MIFPVLIFLFIMSVSAAGAGKIALVTGSNRGIGLELTRRLASAGWCVFATCRAESPELKQIPLNGGKIINGAELSSDEGVNKIVSETTGKKLDLVVNNAGILSVETLDALNPDAIRRQFEVNALAPLRLTAALRSSLSSGSKVVFITSRMGSIADNGSGQYYGYRMSKAALNMAAVSLSKDLAPQGIVVQIVHPGMVDTDMTKAYGGGIPVSESVDGIMKRIEQASMATSGKFFHANGEELPW
jgi:NAD(P)-dependent dehydrogenase (short-subunit alcohol dehydrogenase family)